jgi:acylphosphatase
MTPVPERQRIHAVVRGRVQGVGFRFSTRQQATVLGLSGWVRNTWDGTVEVEAEGPADVVAQFVTWLRRGPVGAHVEHVQTVPRMVLDDHDPFEVRY